MLTIRLAESAEGLNNSLALVAGEFWPKRAHAVVKGINSYCVLN